MLTSVNLTTRVQLRRGFAEAVRQTKTRRNPTNIIKTTAPRRQLQRLVRRQLDTQDAETGKVTIAHVDGAKSVTLSLLQ